MRVLLAGASGALGHTLTPAPRHRPDTRSSARPDRATLLDRRAGATPTGMDGLDRDSVMAAVEEAKPDVIIHQLTSLRAGMDPKQFDRPSARRTGCAPKGPTTCSRRRARFSVGRFLAQSFTGWTNPRTGTGLADETTGLDPHPAPQSRETLAAIRHVEEAVGGATDLEGVVLRYGGFYGPGTGIAKGEDGEILADDPPAQDAPRRAMVAASGPSSMRSTRPAPRWRRSSAARPASTTSSTTSRPACRSGCRRWRRPSAPSRPGTSPLARAAAHRRARGQPHDEDPRLVQRQGEARARLDAALPDLAGGLRQGTLTGGPKSNLSPVTDPFPSR